MSKNRSKRFLRTVTQIMAHVSMICAAMVLTFLIIEIFNPYASFISHALSKQAVLPVSTVLRGAYGLRGLALSVPSVVGKDGVETVLEIPLSPE